MTPYYEDESVTIYHGSALDIVPTLTWDLAITDPPYGVGFQYATYKDTPEAYEEVVIPTLLRLLEGPACAFFMPMKNAHRMPPAKWYLCWYKPGSTRRNALGGFNIWEPVAVYGDGWRCMNDAIRLPDCVNHDKGNEHPCPKPLALLRWVVSLHTGGVILDPFMGSGTTLRAAKDCGHKAIGIEIEEAYCEIAARRMAQEVLAL